MTDKILNVRINEEQVNSKFKKLLVFGTNFVSMFKVKPKDKFLRVDIKEEGYICFLTEKELIDLQQDVAIEVLKLIEQHPDTKQIQIIRNDENAQ